MQNNKLIIIRDLLTLIVASIFLKPFGFLNKKEIWLFMDRPLGVDNGYFLYKYVKKNDESIKSIYICENKQDQQFKKLTKDKGVVMKYSFKHFWYFIHARKVLFSFDTNPFYFYKQTNFLKTILKPNTKFVFLQHGVIKSNVKPYSKEFAKFNFFVTSNKKESMIVKKFLNYDLEIIQTGLARFDNLYNNRKKIRDFIFFMPTWDVSLFNKSKEEFINSKYFKAISHFLNDEKLIDFLKKNNLKLIYIPHYMMLKYMDLFVSRKNKEYILIKTGSEKFEETIGEYLIKSKILITNYSSVLFDFAYLKKPTIYFQFNKYHYEDFFDYKKEGFGEVALTSEDVIKQLKNIVRNKYKLKKEYLKRINNFFDYIDNKNCERLYLAVKNDN